MANCGDGQHAAAAHTAEGHVMSAVTTELQLETGEESEMVVGDGQQIEARTGTGLKYTGLSHKPLTSLTADTSPVCLLYTSPSPRDS